MEIARSRYLEMLKRRMGNGMIKVITGIRGCGKSWLLFRLFYRYLLKLGVQENHIIRLALDDSADRALRDPDTLYCYIKGSVRDSGMYYVLLDEVQYVPEFEDVLNSLLHMENVDAYVTGSHAGFLSRDVITEFRGRGDRIHMFPLSYSEFSGAYRGQREDMLREYMLFGGLPRILKCESREQKIRYLDELAESCIKDAAQRNGIRNEAVLDGLLSILASSIGTLTNPNRLAQVFRTARHAGVSANTIREYLDGLEDAFVVDKAARYDIRKKKHLRTPMKYYFTDNGLRNARIGFRQDEEPHIMENVIFNELKFRGFHVDVGAVPLSERNGRGNYVRKQAEVDFVCRRADRKFYIQSALSVADPEKMRQETRPLMNTGDFFRKIIVVREPVIPWRTEEGILIVGLEKFLTDTSILESL